MLDTQYVYKFAVSWHFNLTQECVCFWYLIISITRDSNFLEIEEKTLLWILQRELRSIFRSGRPHCNFHDLCDGFALESFSGWCHQSENEQLAEAFILFVSDTISNRISFAGLSRAVAGHLNVSVRITP